MRRGAMILLSFLLAAGEVSAQRARVPADGGLTYSLGRPSRLHKHAGFGAGWIFEPDATALVTEARFGLTNHLFNPLLGLLSVHGELYAGARGTDFDYGLRAGLVSPFLRLGAGLDVNGHDRDVFVLITASHPLRRGGVLGRGSQLRLNFLPGRDYSWSLGLEVPVGHREHAGRTRASSSRVKLDATPLAPPSLNGTDPALAEAVHAMAEAAQWIALAVQPLRGMDEVPPDSTSTDGNLAALRDHLGGAAAVGGPVTDVRRYHQAMDRAFSIASGADSLPAGACTELGRTIADHARRVLLEEVLIPYDGLLGQVRDPDSVHGFGRAARGVFLRRLHAELRLPAESIWKELWVFARIIEILEETRRSLHESWGDSRFVWLPLQLALLPEQHDSQAELDGLLERVTGTAFTDGNRVWYAMTEQFPLQLSRTIHAAEDYHVLWIHDIAGVDDQGAPDEMTFRTVGSYIAALTRRVSEYDYTGSLPTYMIFLDQWYYELRSSRRWIDLLQDPLRYELDLPRGYDVWEDSIRAAQIRLRTAVAASRLLQDQAAQFGQSWLRTLVKVHVSITNPTDPSFWRPGIIPLFGLPDDLMRDHRKIAFYDVSEDDPYRGGAIYTGAGIGEHYATPTWEDRSLIVEGPALLTLKRAARELLLDQGIEPERIPWALQPRPIAADYIDHVRAFRDSARGHMRALEVHNETGYDAKDVNVLKAVLYSLASPGSVVIAPDALWTSPFWASLLAGHALRGGRVLIIAPAPANAPSTAIGSMALTWETQARVVHAAGVLNDVITQQGGLLKVGVYNPTTESTDLTAKLVAFRRSLETLPWFRALFDLCPSVLLEMERLGAEMHDLNQRWERTLHFEGAGVPQLHVKANLLASSEAWHGILHRPEWPDVLRAYMEKRAWQIENRDWALGHLDAPMPDVIDVGLPMIERWLAELSEVERDRLVLYLIVGSHNQNHRSMALDGEVAFVVSGTTINAGLLDLVAFTGQCTWVESVAHLSELLPRPGGLRLRTARWLRLIS